MKNRIVKMSLFVLLSLTLAIQTPSFAARPSPSPKSPVVNSNLKRTLPPNEDIKKFVTVLAIIKHYYIKPVTDKKMFNEAIEGMLVGLDPHSAYLQKDELSDLNINTSGKLMGIGVEIIVENGVIKVVTPIDDGPADKSGIKPEDLIVKIDGKLVNKMTMAEAVKKIRGKKGTNVKLTIIRKGEKKPLEVLVQRDEIKVRPVKAKLYDNNFGYLRVAFFQSNLSKAIETAVKKLNLDSKGKLKGVILDLRNNPGGLLDEAVKVSDLFLNSKNTKKYKDLVVYTKGRVPNANLKFKAKPKDIIKGIPLVVLINGGSASASEIVAGALKDYKRAVVMGTKSFGKGSVQTVIPISKTEAVKITTALYYTPAGVKIQGEGITPDIQIEPLKVSSADTQQLLRIKEKDLIDSIEVSKDEGSGQLVKKPESKLKLAQDDYQLYEALITLKALAATR